MGQSRRQPKPMIQSRAVYIHLPVVDMLAEPGYSKVVSQALFGEEVKVRERLDDWFFIETPDGYLGWVQKGAFVERHPYSTDIEVTRLSAHVYTTADTEYGPLFTLPFGSKLRMIDSHDPRWMKVELVDGTEGYIQKGDIAPEEQNLILLSQKFLGLPYTWGGRSSFGYDCSGYIQMLYSRSGIQLPRDARQQILDPRCKPIALEQLKPGDLLFWGKSEQEIKHVGMSLGGLAFIHTSARENKPYLRMSSLNDQEWSGHSDVYYPYRTARRIIRDSKVCYPSAKKTMETI